MKPIKPVRLVAVLLPFILSGCYTPWHSQPPAYVVYPAPALVYRLDTTNWLPAGEPVVQTVQEWNQSYSDALEDLSPWVPNPGLLLGSTFTNVCLEYGRTNAGYLLAVTNTARSFLLASNGFFRSTNTVPNAGQQLTNKVGRMLMLADRENRELFTTNNQLLKKTPHSNQLPAMTSPDLPVGVSVTASWEENPTGQPRNPATTPAKTSRQQVASDKMLVTIETAAASPRNPEPAGQPAETESPESALPDFQPDQQVTLSVSTVLNSASALDRIESVSTYVYFYPWPLSLNGNVILEKEFWRNFFSLNTARDPRLRTNPDLLRRDLFRALEDIRVHVHDLGTTVDLAQVDLGTLDQTFAGSFNAGLNATAKAEPYPLTLSPQLSYKGDASATGKFAPKLQFAKRSTYIDPPADFFRIDQRGMQSVDLAGRYKESVSLHVPAASEPMRVLVPPRNSNDLCEVQTLAQPLYSQVDAITFSVVVVRQATALKASTEDRYGLDDARDAAFIVGVTPLQRFKLWQWERACDGVTTWDIFGKTPGPARTVFFTTFPGETPAPLYLMNFTAAQYNRLLAEIRRQLKTASHGLVEFTGRVGGIGDEHLKIGCVTDEDDPRELIGLR
jgi:hypothetical protein